MEAKQVLDNLLALKKREKSAVDRTVNKQSYRKNWKTFAQQNNMDESSKYLFDGFTYVGMDGFKEYLDEQDDRFKILDKFYKGYYQQVKGEAKMRACFNMLALLFSEVEYDKNLIKRTIEELVKAEKQANDRQCQSAAKMQFLEIIPADIVWPKLSKLCLPLDLQDKLISVLHKCLNGIDAIKLKGRVLKNYNKLNIWIKETKKVVPGSVENPSNEDNSPVVPVQKSEPQTEEDSKNLQEQLIDAKSKIEQLTAEKTTLETQLTKVNNKYNELSETHQKDLAKIQNLNTNYQILANEKNNLQLELENKETKISELENKLKNSTALVDILDGEADRQLNLFKQKIIQTINVEERDLNQFKGQSIDAETGEILIIQLENLYKRIKRMCEK